MIHALVLGCSLLAVVPTPVVPSVGRVAIAKTKPAKSAEELAKGVQRFYDRMRDFKADFIQEYTRVALSKTTESRGKLMLKKPGLMRWEYAKPAEKLWVADGKQLFVYDKEEEQVFIDSNFEPAKLTSSISFLWGKGKLTDSFHVALTTPHEHGGTKGKAALALTPKQDATYAKLVLVIDPRTYQVTESIIYETSGNKNHFKFRNEKLNSGIKADRFVFSPPPGAEIIRR